MSDAIVQRLLWKEYRTQRGFWLSMACLAVIAQVIVLVMPERPMLQGIPRVDWLIGLALGFPAFYALGCGATLFAAEREEGTLEQLRVLAASGWTVWWSKLAFGVVSTAFLMAILWSLAFALSGGQLPSTATQGNLWCVAAVEFLAWGIFFSLLTKRPLNAACLAAVASLIGAWAASWLMFDYFRDLHVARLDMGWAPTSVARLILAGTILLLDVWIALFWVLERPWRVRRVASSEGTGSESLGRRVAIASAVCFCAVILFPTLVFALSSPVPRSGPLLFGLLRLAVVALAEALAWAVFFSLTTRRTHWAVLWAAMAGFVNCHVWTLVVASIGYPGRPMLGLDPWMLAVPTRLFIATTILAVDVWLALRWRAESRLIGRDVATFEGPSQSPSALRRLVWQERRQAWKTILVFGAVAFAVMLFYGHADPLRDEVSFVVAIFVGAVISSLMGSCAFLAEQEENHFRFFADRGVDARRVWLVKHLVWLPAALATTGLFYLLGTWWRPYNVQGSGWFDEFGAIAVVPLTTYAAGQLASMLCKRGLIAGFVGLVLSSVFMVWLGLMQWIGVSLWWSVWPIPAILMLATRVRSSDWLLERTGWRAWLRLGVLLLVPFVALAAAVAAYRALEVRGIGPGFSVEKLLRPGTAEGQEDTGRRTALPVL